jgi:cytidylate kinase
VAIVAINQQLGSRGAELGRIVAEQLSYRFLTSADIEAEAARRYNVTAENLKIIDERQPHFWERLRTDIDRLVAFFRAVMLSEVARDRTVIVGRWLGLSIPQGACTLRVRAAAPFADRVRQTSLDEKLDPAGAERRVRDYDREIRARAQNLHGVDIDDPVLYTMVVNTSAMPLDALAATIAACVRQTDELTREGIERVRDTAIAAQIRAALLAHPKIGSARFSVECVRGAVRICGVGLVPPWDELVDKVARKVDGVGSVEVSVEQPPMPPRGESA